MQKSRSEINRASLIRIRQHARSVGRCIVCRVMDSQPEKSVCSLCNEAAKLRVAKMRMRNKEQRAITATIHTFEKAGSAAMKRFQYIEASTQYERALAQQQLTLKDEIRLCEKMGQALFHGVRPELARPWFERALQQCLSVKSLRGLAPNLALNIAGLLWIEARTCETPAIIQDARTLIARHVVEDRQRGLLSCVASGLATSCFFALGRYREAIAEFLPEDNPYIPDSYGLSRYFKHGAILQAAQGNTLESIASFERSIESAKTLFDGRVLISIWDEYAVWATELGNFDLARSCYERALFVARERRLEWRIPYQALHYASALATAGDYASARRLLGDALTYDLNTPVLRVLKSTVALELAGSLSDAELQRYVVDDGAIELAFLSGEPRLIGQLVAPYVRLSALRGDVQRAQTHISRAIALIPQETTSDHIGELLALTAQYGSKSDAKRAKLLLLERLKRPYAAVAQAYLELWEAHAAIRERKIHKTKSHAERAAQYFADLGWKRQQSEALALIGKNKVLQRVADIDRLVIFEDLQPALTNREQQVAELVLQGLTNRAISEVLLISERTVESHMTSILNRLGLRSRWQLTNFIR